MAYYKQRTDNFDQMTYDFMKATADDYRRRSKLLDLREQHGLQKVKQRLNQLKKNCREKELAR